MSFDLLKPLRYLAQALAGMDSAKQLAAGFALGMAVGLIQYVLTRKGLPESVHYVPDPLPRSKYPLWAGIAVGVVVLVAVLAATGVLNAQNLATVVAALAIVGAVVIFAILLASKKLDSDERSRVVSFIPLFIGTAAFFALFSGIRPRIGLLMRSV